jgi:tetratricopeptide (TPR) repeat protein
MGEHEQAIAALNRVRALNPSYSGNYFGAVLYRAGEPAKAIDELKRHIQLDPYYPPATAGWLGLAHGRHEQFALAIPHHQEFVTRSPENRHAHAWFAATLAMMGDLERARKEAAEVLRIDPNYRISTGLLVASSAPRTWPTA